MIGKNQIHSFEFKYLSINYSRFCSEESNNYNNNNNNSYNNNNNNYKPVFCLQCNQKLVLLKYVNTE